MNNIQELNELANDILVARLELESLEAEKEELLKENARYQQLLLAIEAVNIQKILHQNNLLFTMQQAQLKSWKTNSGNFARASRATAAVDPAYKKAIERELKEGKEVEGWNLNTTEYISIKANK